MYGSIRACCAATTELEIFPREGVKWGDRKLLCISLLGEYMLTSIQWEQERNSDMLGSLAPKLDELYLLSFMLAVILWGKRLFDEGLMLDLAWNSY